MEKIKKVLAIPNTNLKFLQLFGLMIIIFAVFRTLFIFRYHAEFATIPFSEIIWSYIVGLRQDITMICFFIAPFLLVGSLPYIGIEFSKKMNRIIRYLMSFSFAFITVLMVVNLEFFEEYNSHLNLTSIQYLDSGGLIFHMIWEEYPVIKYLLLMLIFIAVFILMLKVVIKKIEYRKVGYTKRISFFIISAILIFIGIRGSAKLGATNWGSAYFSKYNILNQVALNPLYNLYKDIYYSNKAKKKKVDEKLKYFETNEEAVDIVKSNILANGEYLSENFPLFKQTNYEEEKQYNVVLILMESFAAEFVGLFGDDKKLTPEFDKLAQEAVTFNNFYSNGTRTCRGISATLCSFPALNTKSIMKQVEGQQKIPNLASIMKSKGYSTQFIYGGDVQFDNMKGFLLSKGVDSFIAQEDFDSHIFINKWGAPDEFMYKRAVEEIDKVKDKPFFTTILTLTNHPPFTVPEGNYEKVSTGSKLDNNYNTIKYADYALGMFIEEMKTKEYFDNTIFIIVGDHSRSYHHDLAFDYRTSHVPLMIHAPKILDKAYQGKIIEKIASQIDIAPTLVNMMQLNTKHSFWGNNLFDENYKGYAFVTNNSRIGLIENGYYLMGKLGQENKLLKYGEFNSYDYSTEFPNIKKSMEEKMYGMGQTAFYLFKNRKIAM